MPSGKVHRKHWRWFLFVPLIISFVVVIFSVYQEFQAGVWVGMFLPVGYLLGTYLDPDLDQVGISSSDGRMLKIPVIGVILVAWFIPYGYFLKHRSFITHVPFVSTAVRLLYVILLPFVLSVYFVGIPSIIDAIRHVGVTQLFDVMYRWWFYVLPGWVLIYCFLGVYFGLSFSDTIHWAADMIYTKRRKKAKKKT